jgi:undecaprenyl-diphosphatase
MAGLYIDSGASRRTLSRVGNRAWYLGYGGAAAALFGIMTLLVVLRDGAPMAADVGIYRWTYGTRGPFLTGAAKVLDFCGRYYWYALFAVLAALIAYGLRERRVTVGVLAIVFGLGGWVELIKWGVGRPRPNPAYQLIEVGGNSFPSGHAAGMMAVCLLAFVLARRYLRDGGGRYIRETVLAALPLLTGWSRLHLGVHYLSDVLAGWFLGAAWFCLCWWWVRGGDTARWR